MILERFCNIFSIIKQTSHKASGAEEKELPRKIFSWGILRGSCRWAAESLCPAAAPRGQRDTGGWFWDFDRGKGRAPSFLGVFPTADKTRRTRPGTEETAANCMKSALKRSIFLCYAVKTLEISAFHCKIKRKRIKTKRKRREIMRFTPFFNKSAVFSCVRRCFRHFGEIL